MKKSIAILLGSFLFAITVQAQSLEKIWQTDTVIAVPESVLPRKKLLYVSLIDGQPWGADGKGGVAILDRDGKVINSNWITGLNAPKGMGIKGNLLYVADITDVVVINLKKGKIIKKIRIDSAQALNDVTITNNGVVYVSDSRKGNIWRLENDVPALYLQNLRGVNGLKSIKDELYIGAGKSFMKATADKQLTTLTEVPQGIDGIEPIGNGDFILTSWGGWVYYVTAAGKVTTLLDTSAEKKNTADIGYDQKKRILYVPTFNAKTVVAYKVK